MNWFQRHLNWTVFTTYAVFGIFIGLTTKIEQYANPSENTIIIIDIAIIILFIGTIIIDIWALRKKNRSLWWLALIIPFGWIPYICLSNKSSYVYHQNSSQSSVKIPLQRGEHR